MLNHMSIISMVTLVASGMCNIFSWFGVTICDKIKHYCNRYSKTRSTKYQLAKQMFANEHLRQLVKQYHNQ